MTGNFVIVDDQLDKPPYLAMDHIRDYPQSPALPKSTRKRTRSAKLPVIKHPLFQPATQPGKTSMDKATTMVSDEPPPPPWWVGKHKMMRPKILVHKIENYCFRNESLVTFHIRNSNPNILILVLCEHHTQARQTLSSGCSTGSWSYCCTSLITHGSLLGSKKKVVTASLSP